MKGFGNFLAAAAASIMLGASMAMPPMGQRYTPPIRRVAYDGEGRKLKPKAHPNHNAKRRSRSWERYAEKVQATHSHDAFGHWQEDPRDDKYLHSYARQRRAARLARIAA